MPDDKRSGQNGYVFRHIPDLHTVPTAALANEVRLHGGASRDSRDGYGHVYYGITGSGIVRVSADLSSQELLALPPEYIDKNFHTVKVSEFDGKTHLLLPMDGNAMVAVATLDGEIEIVLPKPELNEY
ncbi:MAG: hypothetical protein O3A46_17440, partial [Candidatus Poribacteria bacterium]|nr:hypothetical protein [Candidatus Poribacteria bacterium]